MVIVAGAKNYILIGKETTWGTKATTIATDIGIIDSVTPTMRNNRIPYYSIGGGRKYVACGTGNFEMSFDIGHKLQSPAFFEFLLGNLTAGTPNTIRIADDLPSFTLRNGLKTSTEELLDAVGCVVNQCTIRGSVGNPLEISASCLARNVDIAAGSEVVTIPDDQPYAFHHGVLKYPSTTKVGILESFEMVITNEFEVIGDCSTRFAAAFVPKNVGITYRANVRYEDSAHMDGFFGQADSPIDGDVPDLTNFLLELTNGSNYCYIKLLPAAPNDYNLPQNLNEIVNEELIGFAQDCQIDYVHT